MKLGKLTVIASSIVAVVAGCYWLLSGSSRQDDASRATSAVAEATPGADAAPANDIDSNAVAENPAEGQPSEEDLAGAQTAQQQQPEPAPFNPPPPMEDYEDDDLAGNEDSAETMAEFAQDLSGMMERALESEKEALPAFAELERCAGDTDGHGNVQAQLICFANASRLSREYPGLLGNRFVSLAKQNPKLVSMLENTGLE